MKNKANTAIILSTFLFGLPSSGKFAIVMYAVDNNWSKSNLFDTVLKYSVNARDLCSLVIPGFRFNWVNSIAN